MTTSSKFDMLFAEVFREGTIEVERMPLALPAGVYIARRREAESVVAIGIGVDGHEALFAWLDAEELVRLGNELRAVADFITRRAQP